MNTADRTIRVFVSSTFRDMHAERDVLNRIVFPELRERCQHRGAEFIGVDLRWGVTEDEAQGTGALAVCLDEIERCRPFFVCLLGDRYGWVPAPEEVSAAIFDAARASGALPALVAASYQRDDTVEPAVYRLWPNAGRATLAEDADALTRFWEARGIEEAGDSITAREILRGAFDTEYPSTHALFYLRTSHLALDSALPSSFRSVFAEPDKVRTGKLEALKARIRDASDRVVVRDYQARYAGLTIDAALLPGDLSTDDRAALDDGVVTPEEWSRISARLRQSIEQHGTVALTEMDVLADRVLDDLWHAIEPELERPVTMDAHQRERAYHDRFVSRHAEFFRGRDPERARVISYVADREDRELLVITGTPGSGKSAFMADCARVCRALHPEALVIPHFIGAAPDSASLPATLRSLCETLRRDAGVDETVADDPDKLRFQLRTFLEQAGAKRPVILFLDALNQADPSGRSHELDWLPVWAPPGTRIVVSTLAGDCLDQLNRHVPPNHVVTIEALPVDERRALASEFLARRRKALTADQLDALMDIEKRPDAGLPLYELVALEELCLFGDHEALTERIHALPATLAALFDQVLARVEHDHTHEITKNVCSWLAVARSGLLESEVLDLLGVGAGFPRIRWTRLYRALEPYLKPIEEARGSRTGGRLDFYHDQFRLAAHRRYLHMVGQDATPTDRFRDSHRQLAGYFRSVAYDESLPDKWRRDRVRGLSELPFHQTRGEVWEELEATLCDLDFIAAKCAADMTYAMETDYDEAVIALPEGRVHRKREQQYEERMVQYTRELIEYAGQWSLARDAHERDPTRSPWPDQATIPLPEVPPIVRMWTDEEIEDDSERITSSPTRSERIRAFGNFVRSESHYLVRFAACPGFCLQQARNSARTGPVAQAATASLDDKGRPFQLLRAVEQRPPWIFHPACERTLAGHLGRIDSVAITPDGRFALSTDEGRSRKMLAWNLATGACVRELAAGPVAMTPDGRHAIVGNQHGTLEHWNLATGTRERILGQHLGSIEAVAVTPDGRRAVSGGQLCEVRLWDLANGDCEWTIAGEEDEWVTAVEVTADGQRLVVGHSDGTLRVWVVRTGECEHVLNKQLRWVSSLAVTLDGRRVFVRSLDGRSHSLWLWDLATENCERVLTQRPDDITVAVTPDARLCVSGCQNGIVRIWDLATGACNRTLTAHRGPVDSVAITPDGRRAISGGLDETVRVWNLTTGTTARTLHEDVLEIHEIALVPAEHRAISGGVDGVKVWNLESGACERTLSMEKRWVGALAVTPDGRQAVSTDNDHTLRAWDVATGTSIVLDGAGETWALAITPDGRRVVSAGKAKSNSTKSFDWTGILQVSDLATGAVQHTLLEQARPVAITTLTPDGRRVVSWGRDDIARVWDLETGSCEHTLEFGGEAFTRALALTPDGRYLLSVDNTQALSVWDLATGTVGRTMFTGLCNWPLIVTPDGRRALSTGLDGSLQVFDLANWAHERTLIGHDSSARVLAVTPDGRRAVSGGGDKTLRVWDLATGVTEAILPTMGSVAAVAVSARHLVFGTSTGELGILNAASSLLIGVPLATPTRLWQFSDPLPGLRTKRSSRPRDQSATEISGHWDEHLTVRCTWCGHRFAVEPPDPASDGADVVCPAPDCGQPLHLNPFVCDPRDSDWG